MLLAGFPCQAFSIAGRKLGFEDARGTHFFEIARILKERRPRAFLLENVRHFQTHDEGRTFQTIKNIIENELGYTFYYKLLNAKNFGLPQNRERIYMVGFRDYVKFQFPKPTHKKTMLKNILEKRVSDDYFISQKYYTTLKKHRERHENKGNGFGYIVLDKNNVSNTIVLGGMGRERNLVIDKTNWKRSQRTNINNAAIRVLTPRECLRLQGFPDAFKTPVAKTHLWRQAANSVAVTVIEKIARRMKISMEAGN